MKNDLNVEVETSSISVQRVKKQGEKSLVAKSSEKLEKQVGSTLTKPVMGQEVVFTLQKIPAKKVEQSTMVWLGNERDQELLDEFAIADILETYKDFGQEMPAFGRNECGIVQVADGSRRRFTSIFTRSDFYIWVGELSEEQMDYLTDVGNQYKPTSAYEQGMRALRHLNAGKGQEEVAKMVGKARRAMMREVNTAKLPRSFIRALPTPNDLSARKGEALFKLYDKLDEHIKEVLNHFFDTWCSEKGKYDTDKLVEMFVIKCGKKTPEPVAPRELAMGTTVKLKNGNATINIPKVSDESLKLIEAFIDQTLSKEALDKC
ncbi:chromosome partitioning protein, ParB family [Vibrio xiamenensis]|uniref:Chromosome partitioning protein, ParB family n=1 Tax=Vibrio xiamenensis TaxID=861298 RepID=A0A1G8HX63_9VIBR|nr:ParB/RepB/Spo0J family partition protein [Vibrio xiamenensis]SDI11259.1 chromosome partitioning protein, ParB family [Vibrio xiamenensis]